MILNKWLSTVAEAGKGLLSGQRSWFPGNKPAAADIEFLCEELVSSKGEALGTALAFSAVEALQNMDDVEKTEFFRLLFDKYSVSDEAINDLIGRYQYDPTPENRHALHRLSEPPRQELFRRINIAPGGTKAIVELRKTLLAQLPEHPEFTEIDADLRHLIASWFNRGFLTLERIDWRTPAFVLEKLIEYEAVHAMHGFSDLRRRLASDRRCFAFFHPAMADEPLIFVQVALTKGLPDTVQPILESDVNPDAAAEADTATFYSISDCQQGLRGISFGNFLIKQVVMELQTEIPALKQFATLSPIPGFCHWLRSEIEQHEVEPVEAKLIEGFDDPDKWAAIKDDEKVQEILLQQSARYLLNAKRGGKPLDTVARFHLRNGAIIERLNWAADCSENGIRQSAGIMVNYRYDLSHVEERHEGFVNDGAIAIKKGLAKQVT